MSKTKRPNGTDHEKYRKQNDNNNGEHEADDKRRRNPDTRKTKGC